MLWWSRLNRAFERGTLSAARQSQAFVILAVDRVARHEDSRSPRLLGRLLRAQLDVTGMLVGDPNKFVDSAHAYALDLVSLHREFADRLFEAIDTRGPGRPEGEIARNVVPFVRRSLR